MDCALTLSPVLRGVVIVGASLFALLAAIVPTALYLFVEPRGRRMWAADGDTAATRRAPGVVRLTAWLSFALAQVAIPWLIVPVYCAGLLYLQARIGYLRPIGIAVTAGVGVAGLVQAILSLRLWPLGIKLLMHESGLCASLKRRTAATLLANAVVLGAMSMLDFAITNIPHFIHPILRGAIVWGALRPVMIYAVVCLAHAMLMNACCGAMSDGKKTGDGPANQNNGAR
jgi:hypothetical protein